MSVTYPPPRWKTILTHPRYEISEEGQVRVKSGFRNAGYVLDRFWRNGNAVIKYEESQFEVVDGSLCVDLYDYPRHTTARLWILMERYWPDSQYPESWRKKRKPPKPIRKDNRPDKRFKITDQQVREIRESPLSSRQLAGLYPISARHIRAIRQGVKRYA